MGHIHTHKYVVVASSYALAFWYGILHLNKFRESEAQIRNTDFRILCKSCTIYQNLSERQTRVNSIADKCSEIV